MTKTFLGTCHDQRPDSPVPVAAMKLRREWDAILLDDDSVRQGEVLFRA